MLSLSRWFKFSLPVATATTASVATVLLITLSQVDPLKLFDIQDKELNDFELQSKTFEDEIVKEEKKEVNIEKLIETSSDNEKLEEAVLKSENEEGSQKEDFSEPKELENSKNQILESKKNQPNDQENLAEDQLSLEDKKAVKGPEEGGPQTEVENSEINFETSVQDALDGDSDNSDSAKGEVEAGELNIQEQSSQVVPKEIQRADKSEDSQGPSKSSPENANGEQPPKQFAENERGETHITDGGEGELTDSDIKGWTEVLEGSVHVSYMLQAVTDK